MSAIYANKCTWSLKKLAWRIINCECLVVVKVKLSHKKKQKNWIDPHKNINKFLQDNFFFFLNFKWDQQWAGADVVEFDEHVHIIMFVKKEKKIISLKKKRELMVVLIFCESYSKPRYNICAKNLKM